MIPLTVDGLMRWRSSSRLARRDKPFWRTFWAGDMMEGGGKDDRMPCYGAPAAQMLRPMF
jgi:hypothetical protein